MINSLPTTLADGPIRSLFFKSSGNSTFTDPSDDLFMFIFWVSVFFFVLIMGLMGYFMVKYRRRPGVPIERSAAHNTPLELAWSIIPLLILVVMFFWGFHGFLETTIAPSNAEFIDVKAQKWNWNATYANGETPTDTILVGDTEVPIFVVPAESPVLMRMESIDVIHSFWIPDFRVKYDVFPNRYTSVWFESKPLDPDDPLDEEGFPYRDHYVFCAEYCGDQHSEMAAVIRVVPAHRFTIWYESMGVDPNAAPSVKGEYIYRGKGGCIACHSVDGSANTGPTWLDLYGNPRRDADGTEIIADDNFLRESILNPGAHLREGYSNQMVSYQGVLNADEISDLIAYMRKLSGIEDTAEEGGEASDESGEQGDAGPADEEETTSQGAGE